MNRKSLAVAHHIEQLRIGGYKDEARLLEIYSTNVNTEVEFEYLCQFAKESDFFYQLARNQLRSLWTAYCFHANLDVDTEKYDSDLMMLWNCMTVPEDSIDFENFELFDGFMCAELV